MYNPSKDASYEDTTLLDPSNVSATDPTIISLAEAKEKRENTRYLIASVVCMLGLGLALGLGLPPSSNDKYPWNYVSACIGWIYFAAWSLSFYPQCVLNYQRKTTEGLSVDYEAYNIIGFVSYALFNSFFYWDDNIQSAYRASHDGKENKVQLNDVVFALHAVILTTFTIGQIFWYRKKPVRTSMICGVLCIVTLVVMLVYFICCLFLAQKKKFFSWLYYLYFLSAIKVGISFVKYIPQVYLNYIRKSTVGWNIWNVLLDFTGGLLSVGQLVMDSGLTGDWNGITGDPAKFGLGFLSMFFDIIFMVQHYCMYKNRVDKTVIAAAGDLVHDDAGNPLLSPTRSTE